VFLAQRLRASPGPARRHGGGITHVWARLGTAGLQEPSGCFRLTVSGSRANRPSALTAKTTSSLPPDTCRSFSVLKRPTTSHKPDDHRRLAFHSLTQNRYLLPVRIC